jgi:hypothetical protein
VFDKASLEVLVLVRDLLCPIHGSEPPSIRAGLTEHHIPHTGNDHDKTHPIYKIGVSGRWPWSPAGALT